MEEFPKPSMNHWCFFVPCQWYVASYYFYTFLGWFFQDWKILESTSWREGRIFGNFMFMFHRCFPRSMWGRLLEPCPREALSLTSLHVLQHSAIWPMAAHSQKNLGRAWKLIYSRPGAVARLPRIVKPAALKMALVCPNTFFLSAAF